MKTPIAIIFGCLLFTSFLSGCNSAADRAHTVRPTDDDTSTSTTTPGYYLVSPKGGQLAIMGLPDKTSVERATSRYGGVVVKEVEQTNTFAVRVNAKSDAEAMKIRDELRASGIDAVLNYVLHMDCKKGQPC